MPNDKISSSNPTHRRSTSIGRPRGTGAVQRQYAEFTKLERVIESDGEKIRVSDVMTALRKEGIVKQPSESLIRLGLEARAPFAKGLQMVADVYKAAITEGYEPRQARKICWVLVCDRGNALSDRQLRKALPAEAKMLTMTRSVFKSQKPAEQKTYSSKPGKQSKLATLPEIITVQMSTTMGQMISSTMKKNNSSKGCLEITARLTNGDKYIATLIRHAERRG